MKRFGILLAAAVAASAVVVFLSQSFAQAPAASTAPLARLAVCDVITVFNSYEKAKALSATFDAKGSQIAAEDDQRQKSIQQLRERLESLVAGSKEYEARLKELQKLSIERAVWRKLQDEQILRERRLLTEQMYREILAGVAEEAKGRGFDVVIHRESVDIASQSTGELLNKIALRKCLYAKDELDLTQAVLKRVNQKYREANR